MTAAWKPDLKEVEKVCRLHPTDVELAAFFGVSQRTVQRYKKKKNFSEAMERGFGNANLSLRRKQMEVALGGNVTMLIWLGKQFLGQADKVEQVIEDLSDKPSVVTVKVI